MNTQSLACHHGALSAGGTTPAITAVAPFLPACPQALDLEAIRLPANVEEAR